MRRMRHPLTGATYDWAQDGLGPVRVVDVDGRHSGQLAAITQRGEGADQGGRIGPGGDRRENHVARTGEPPTPDRPQDVPYIRVESFLAHGGERPGIGPSILATRGEEAGGKVRRYRE